MSKDQSLLAYLIPRLTGRIEDTTTDALAFILNKSSACREALSLLLREGEESYSLKSLKYFETQVTYEDGSRPDMLGYDREGNKRLIVESKFWASLGENQADGYFDQLEATGSGVLLFIAPDSRLEIMWQEILYQMGTSSSDFKLERVELPGRAYRAKVAKPNDRDKRLILISWSLLLDRLYAAASVDSLVASDLRQLRGLAQSQGEEAFQPIGIADFSPAIPRRIQLFNQLIDDVVDRGCNEDWISVDGLRATPQRGGYGRYFRFKVDNRSVPVVPSDLFLCVHYDSWANKGDTPLWLLMKDNIPINANRPPSVIDYRQRGWRYGMPIRLLTGAERGRVLDDVIAQVKRIRELINDN